ncbi:MAG: pilus assembly protein N-terminal domain-containing protein [Bdellovibrionota bacterium]
MKITLLTSCLVGSFLFQLNASADESNNPTAQHIATNIADNIERPPLFLGAGEQRVLRLSGLTRFSIGDNTIARVTALPKNIHNKETLLIKGIKRGNTDLWVWKDNAITERRTIHVEKNTVEDIKPNLQRALNRLEEAEIIFTATGVVLRGQITTMGEAARVAAVTANPSGEVHDETEPAEKLIKEAAAHLESWLGKRPQKESELLSLEKIGKQLWLRGNIDDPVKRAALYREAKALFPLLLFDVSALPDSSPTVHFKVYLLELKKNHFSSLGIEWPEKQEAAFRVTSSSVDNFLQLDLALQALEGQGSAKILSKPELVVRAPGEAELFSGGEIPLHIYGRGFSNYVWKPFGLILKLHVTHTTARKVRLDINTEVSNLDPTITVDKIPGVQTNKMKTQVDAYYGTPLFLSGLLQESLRQSARGVPLLREIPILGKLFSSDDYLEQRSELVAILMPSLKPPAPPLSKIKNILPSGPMPAPRKWLSTGQQRQILEARDFPWNALK